MNPLSDPSLPVPIEKEAGTKSPSSMRQQILMEAKRLFRDRGFAAVSINDIIEGLGVTKPTLYHYFKDKEALYAEVLLAVMAHGSEFIQDDRKKSVSIRGYLAALAAGYLEHSPTSLATLLRDAGKHLNPDNYKKTQENYQQLLLNPLEKLFLEGLRSEEILLTSPLADKPLEVQSAKLALMFLTYLDTFTILHRNQSAPESNFQALGEHMVSLLWDGLGNHSKQCH